MKKLLIFLTLISIIHAKNYVVTKDGSIHNQDEYYQTKQSELDVINSLNSDFETVETWICEDDLKKFNLLYEFGLLKKSDFMGYTKLGKPEDLKLTTKTENGKVYFLSKDLKERGLIK